MFWGTGVFCTRCPFILDVGYAVTRLWQKDDQQQVLVPCEPNCTH